MTVLIVKRALLAAATSMALVSGIALAQGPAGPSAPRPSERFDRVATIGIVARLLINPFGEIDGLLLASGSVVRFPPHMSDSLAAAVQVGDTIQATGLAETARSFKAYAITNLGNGRSVVEVAPSTQQPPPHLRRASLVRMEASGNIVTLLAGPRGEASGVLLEDGTVVRFPPHAAPPSLAVGQPFAAAGFGTTNAYGRAFEAMAIGVAPGALQDVVR